MKKSTLIFILLITSCFILIIYGLFYINNYNNISNNFKISESKYDFLASSGTLMDFLKDAESSQQGFIITGDQKYIESYQNSIYRFQQEKARFIQLINRCDIYNDNKTDFDEIDNLMNQKIAEMDQSISFKKSNNSQAAVNVVINDAGMQIMGKIHALFQKLSINQKFKEAKAKQDIYSYRNQFKIYTMSTGIFIFICLLTIGVLFTLNEKESSITQNQIIDDSFIADIDGELNGSGNSSKGTKDFIPSI